MAPNFNIVDSEVRMTAHRRMARIGFRVLIAALLAAASAFTAAEASATQGIAVAWTRQGLVLGNRGPGTGLECLGRRLLNRMFSIGGAENAAYIAYPPKAALAWQEARLARESAAED
jgi:hypothetical protein